MDRLTEPNYTYDDCDFMDSGMAPYMNRLAAYEDTGLTPEVINKWAGVVRFFEDADISNLIELADAEKEGRLIVLPCKVGDTVYIIIDGKIHKGEVYHISYSNYYGEITTTVWTKGGVGAAFDHFGKCAFLTSEEAEAALAKEAHNGE